MWSTYDQWKLRSPDDQWWCDPLEQFECDVCDDMGCRWCMEPQPIELEDLDEMCGTAEA